MTSKARPQVLFYHSYFFRKSETFIYQQAINPHIQPYLLAKRYYRSAELPTTSFTKFQFGRPLIAALISRLSKWIGQQPYYGPRSVSRLKRKLQGQSFDVLHAQFGGNGVRILPLAKALHIPLVVSFHGFDASRKLASRSYREGLKEVFDYASAIVVCNPGMADALPLSESNRKKVRWVPYGINIEQFSGSSPSSNQNTFNVLHVGRLVEKKGVPDLVRAFAKAAGNVKEMNLHIVGTGRDEGECRNVVKENNLESKVIFHGWKSPSEVKRLMQQCDVFILNSRVAANGETEGLPVGLLEAMAMGMAVISTRHAGIPLAVEDDISGVLVNERDTDSLARQLVRLYQNKPLRQALGQAARAKVENQFTMRHMHENLYRMYCDVADRKAE